MSVILFSRSLEVELQCAIVQHVAEFDTLPGHADPDDRRWRNCLSDLCDRRNCAVCSDALRGKFGTAFQMLTTIRRDRRLLERAERRGESLPFQMANALQIQLISRTIEQLHQRVVAALVARGA